MSKKEIVFLSIFLIVFPFAFQIGVRALWHNSLELDPSLALQTEILALILLSLIFGRLYCGTLCQMGALQRLLNLVGIKILKKRFEIPQAVDKYLRLLKYAFLFIIIIASVYNASILYNPYMAVAQFSYLLPDLTLLMSIFFVLLIGGSIFFNNFFCKYLCVQGAINGLAGRLSGLKIKRDPKNCRGCRKCSKKCPANIQIHALEAIRSTECLYCQTCIMSCPISYPGKEVLGFYLLNRRISYPILLIAIVVAYIVLTICISALLSF